MSNPKNNKRLRKKQKHSKLDLLEKKTDEKKTEIIIIAILLAFGVYHSVIYFGHQTVPNPDFTGFVNLGHQLLSLQYPSDFKRAPVLGLLQAVLSHCVGTRHPDLTAGWLLNAILHPFNLVLLYLVGKKIIGKAAVWLAIITIINPWVIQSLTEPIAETSLLFFIFLTFYFIMKRSKWAYLFASITSVLRYEGAALILAAFVVDILSTRDKRKWLLSLIYSAIATIPLALWMLGTILSFEDAGKTHYIKELGASGEASIDVFVKYLEMIWRVGFYPLFTAEPIASKDSALIIFKLSKVLAASSFVFGAVYALCKRRWNILALLIFLALYVMVHVVHSGVAPRYCCVIHWIPLLICFYGLQNIWGLINKGQRIPKIIVAGLQGILLIIAFIWIWQLAAFLPKIATVSPVSVSIPYVAAMAAVAISIVSIWADNRRDIWRRITILSVVCLIVVSNQFVLVQMVGNGKRNLEFKLLADWYVDNAKPGEKMLTTMNNIVNIFAPEHKDSLLHPAAIEADNPNDYVRKCYEEGITYVTWDSRIGLGVGSRYYNLWNIKNIAMLSQPKSIGPYEFVEQIRVSQRRYINIFRLRSPGG